MLAVGTRLGVFEIVDSLGAGGMGEVYRARDTKLGRDVVAPPSDWRRERSSNQGTRH
jgi:hypothetical protein